MMKKKDEIATPGISTDIAAEQQKKRVCPPPRLTGRPVHHLPNLAPHAFLFLQMTRAVNLYRNFVTFASLTADRLNDDELISLRHAVEKLDNKDRVIRAQTLRERPMLYSEFVTFGMYLIERQNFLTKNSQVAEMVDNIILRRWAQWHIKVGRAAGDDYVSAEAGLTPH